MEFKNMLLLMLTCMTLCNMAAKNITSLQIIIQFKVYKYRVEWFINFILTSQKMHIIFKFYC